MPKNSKKAMNNLKLKNKVEKLILKYSKKNSKQEKILNASKNAQNKLEVLLKKIPNENKNEENKELSKELSQIHKEFKVEMKKIKLEAKRERKEKKKEKKEKRKLRKQEKKEKELRLENSRIEELPELKENDLVDFNIMVDGWNISGCDKIARKSMRGKRGKGAIRMINLLSLFGNNSNYMKSNGKNVNLTIHFDGNGKSRIEEFENGLKISVLYSGKSEIVDDRLVRELSKNIKSSQFSLNGEIAFKVKSNPNRNVLVITSDRELTLRLNKIGVNCMKSGCFYKKYLKEFEFYGLEEKESVETMKMENEKPKKEFKNKNKNKNKNKSKKHWKKYIKNRFSDNSSSSNSSSSSSSDSDMQTE